MQVTEKMIKAALESWFGEPVTEPYNEHVDNMRFAIQAAIQAAWVNFDPDDNRTHPQPKYRQKAIVAYDDGRHGKLVSCDIYAHGDFNGTTPTHWMPLPEFNEV
jgi:hypothetical protein